MGTMPMPLPFGGLGGSDFFSEENPGPEKSLMVLFSARGRYKTHENPINIGRNYQPQLVQKFFQQQYDI